MARHQGLRSALGIAGITSIFVLLVGSSIDYSTVQYDEFSDLRIAESLVESPLTGSAEDGSQARLPMYVTAAVQRVLQVFKPDLDRSDVLLASRWISVLATIAATVGTYFLGCRLFDPTIALLGALLFALSPHTLQFGRDALTQGDALTPMMVVLSLLAFTHFDRERRTAWVAGLGLSLGLAIATKFFLIILIPALFVSHQVLWTRGARWGAGVDRSSRVEVRHATSYWLFLLLAVGAGSVALLALALSLYGLRTGVAESHALYRLSQVSWGVSVALVVISCLVAFSRAGRSSQALGLDRRGSWQLAAAWVGIVALAGAVSLSLFPAHILNPDIITLVIKRGVTETPLDGRLATSLTSAKLYLGILLFKLGLPLGIATCAALVWAAFRARREHAVLVLMLVLISYGTLLLLLPLQQPYWLMSIYPLITLLVSAFLVRLIRSGGAPAVRIGWGAAVMAATIWLAIGIVRVYPTFGYYGHEAVGDRWLGEESRGYRRLVVVTNDGSTLAMQWLHGNAPRGSFVLSYLDDAHVVDHETGSLGSTFEVKHAVDVGDDGSLDADLAKADFVVVRSVEDFGAPSPVAAPGFRERFGTTPAHEIVRGRGAYRMVVIRIYKARSPLSGSSNRDRLLVDGIA